MTHASSTFPTKYLIRHLMKKMASQDDQQYALQDQERRDLNHSLFLDDQQRRINHRKMLEASYRSPICPYYSLSGHDACSTCHQNALSHQNALTQSSTSMGDLLRSLSRPPSHVSPSIHSTSISV
jgi:ferredoxin